MHEFTNRAGGSCGSGGVSVRSGDGQYQREAVARLQPSGDYPIALRAVFQKLYV